MKATFSQAGSFTTIQDGGRFGMAHLGFPPSGFMDAVSARLANRLVANEPDEALLEITWTGVEFSVDVACAVALTGAQFACTLNGKPIDTYGVVSLQAGDCLRMGQLLSGVRAYLSFAGGLSLPKVGRSVSTLTLAGLGGLHGRPLQAGDELPLKQPQQVTQRAVPAWYRWPQQNIHVVRALPGPEFALFESGVIQQALSQPYQISQDSNRQGFRLQSSPIQGPEGFHMVSSGLLPGTLQVTPDGQTILVMHDGQTTGGYPRLLVVKQDELHKLAQIRPHQDIYFFCER